MPAFSDEEEQHPVEPANGARTPDQHTAAMEPASSPGGDSHAADALAALSFLETSASPEKSSMRDLPSAPQASSSEDRRLSLPRITTDFNGSAQAVAPVGQDARPQPPQFPSSFGPGKAAAERRAKLEAAERERQEALHKPGRGKGQPTFKKPPRAGGWQSSDEDDEEEENDEEEDEDEDRARNGAHASQAQMLRPLPQNPSSGQLSSREQQPARSPSQYDLQPRSEADAYANGHHFGSSGNQARPASNYVVDNGGHSLPQSTSRSTLHQVVQPQPRATGGMPHSRSTMWNTHLETPHGGQAAEQEDSGKFVTIEPAATLTKAFNPNGLLQAGLADRDERSAKRQEELAKADGSSLGTSSMPLSDAPCMAASAH
jgi:CCR4-NOT transcriptional complex subunit CAF120